VIITKISASSLSRDPEEAVDVMEWLAGLEGPAEVGLEGPDEIGLAGVA
jgi:hypothetical protein